MLVKVAADAQRALQMVQRDPGSAPTRRSAPPRACCRRSSARSSRPTSKASGRGRARAPGAAGHLRARPTDASRPQDQRASLYRLQAACRGRRASAGDHRAHDLTGQRARRPPRRRPGRATTRVPATAARARRHRLRQPGSPRTTRATRDPSARTAAPHAHPGPEHGRQRPVRHRPHRRAGHLPTGQHRADLQTPAQRPPRRRRPPRTLYRQPMRALPAPRALRPGRHRYIRSTAAKTSAKPRYANSPTPPRPPTSTTRPRIERLLGLIVYRYHARTSRYNGARKTELQAAWTATLSTCTPSAPHYEPRPPDQDHQGRPNRPATHTNRPIDLDPHAASPPPQHPHFRPAPQGPQTHSPRATFSAVSDETVYLLPVAALSRLEPEPRETGQLRRRPARDRRIALERTLPRARGCSALTARRSSATTGRSWSPGQTTAPR